MNLGAGPEVGGGGEVVGGDGFPEGVAEPPLGIVGAHGEFFTSEGVEEEIVDDAVVGRVEAGDDGVVVGECESGEDGDEAGEGFCAVEDEAVDVGGGGFVLVAEAEAVGGDEDDDGVGEEGGGGG